MKHAQRVAITGWGFYGAEPGDINSNDLEDGTIIKGCRRTAFAKLDPPTTKALLPGISTRLVDRQSILAGIAAGKAAEQYIECGILDRGKTGVALGSTFGSMVSILRFHKSILTEGGNFVNPSEFPNVVANAAASRLGIWYGLKGRCISLSDGLLSGIDAVGFAYDGIRRGTMEHYVAGDSEELSGELCRAYARMSEGLIDFCGCDDEVLCEGAGVAVLSRLETAKACGMEIMGEIAGYVNTAYRKEEFLPEKIIASVLKRLTGTTEPDYGSFVFCSSLNPLSGISGPLAREAEKRFGRDNVHIENRKNGAVVNRFGLSGVMNIKNALDMPAVSQGSKAAVVVEADDGGRVSALLVKKPEQ